MTRASWSKVIAAKDAAAAKAGKPSKYGNVPSAADGIKFSSKAEMRYYLHLKTLIVLGELRYFLRQVPLHLPGNTRYVVDFLEFWADGRVRYVDVKGMETATFKFKRKQVQALYPIEIETETRRL